MPWQQPVTVQRLIKSGALQAKLMIGPLMQRQKETPEEEKESVQAKFKDSERIQRMCPECKEETAQRQPVEELQTKSKPGETPTVTPSLESRINNLKGGGQPLDPATRNYFEPRIGHDFSEVRVHNSNLAAEIAHSVSARAFTSGQDIVFSTGQYAPGMRTGRQLLAHELTHVV